MIDINSNHPRAESLKVREKLADGFREGLVTPEGLTAHGRGETFDYIIGEKTTNQAKRATRAGLAEILLAKNPTLSVNGNVAALVPEEIAILEKMTNMKIEVNLFHSSKTRARKIADHLKENGVKEILGIEKNHTSIISEIQSSRKKVDERGIETADLVIVPLEDGDRTEALKELGKTVITVDLNPMSRTSKAADVTIVDNIVRSLPFMIGELERLSKRDKKDLKKISREFDNEENLRYTIKTMLKRLRKLSGKR